MDWLKNLSGRTKLFAGIAAVVIALDQWTKYLAVASLTRIFEPVAGGDAPGFIERIGLFLTYKHPARTAAIPVIESFWHFRYVENPGAAWGFLNTAPPWFRTPFFLLVSLAAMVFIVVYFKRSKPSERVLRVALALIFGGAVGNFLDRVRLQYVIDFIDWHWYDKATWPTFNIADSAISIGVGLLILDMFLKKPDEEQADGAKQSPKKNDDAVKATAES